MGTNVRRGTKRSGTAELARALRGLDELIAKGDRRKLEAERSSIVFDTVRLAAC